MQNRKVHVMKNLPFYCSASEKVQMLDEERRKNVVCIEVKSLMAAPDAFHTIVGQIIKPTFSCHT